MAENYPSGILSALFDAIRWFTLSSGGDGEGWIISPHFRELALKFEEDEKNANQKWFTRKTISDYAISFAHGQECIIFADNRSRLPSWAGDIVVEIP